MTSEKNVQCQSKKAKVISGLKSILLYALMLAIVVFIVINKNGSGNSIGGYRALVVLTSSMEPEILAGSLAIIAPADSDSLEVDDIITFTVGDSYLTHRIASVTEQGEYITKGDSNQANDPNAVNGDDIVGKYWFSIPHLGRALVFLTTPLGLILLIISLVVLYLCYIWFHYYVCKRGKSPA